MHPTRQRLLFVLTLASLAAPAFADPLAADSHVGAVTVYPDRAVVTREAKLMLPAGESEIEFKDLPQGLMENSLQVSGTGAGATILDVTAKTILIKESPNARIREAEQKIKEVEAQVRQLNREIRVHQDAKQTLGKQSDLLERAQKNYLEAPAPPSGKDAVAVYAKPKMEDYQTLLAFSAAKQDELQAQVRKHDDDIDALNEKIADANRNIEQLRQQGTPPARYSRVVTVRVDAAQAGELALKLSYATGGASWAPSYDVRLKDRAAAVTYFGNVRQNTGEDWLQAQLTLSTAKPDLGGAAPGLSAWVLDVQQAMPLAQGHGGSFEGRSVLAGSMSNYNKVQEVAAAKADADFTTTPAAPAAIAYTQVAAEGTHAVFKIERPTSIPSNNQSFKVSIAKLDLNGKLQYQAVPAMNDNAYLTGYFKLAGDYPFLAGPANIFLGDSFVTTSPIPTTMPGAVLMTSFGADDGISIKRALTDKLTETTGFTSGYIQVTYAYAFTLENHKKTAERVFFKDHLPVSRNEKIVVKLLAPEPGNCGKKPLTTAQALSLTKETTLEDDGEICWRIDLKPGEKRIIPLKFSVECPKEMAVSGL